MPELVDSHILKRSESWEWGRKDENQGGFNLNPNGYDSFANSPKELTSAYIIWVLTEIKYNNLKAQISYLLKVAELTSDPYILGLCGNAFYNYELKTEGRICSEKIIQKKNGCVNGAKNSITRSGGKCLIIETTSLALLTWMNEPAIFLTKIKAAINFIMKNVKGGGYFHGTQSTILALKAIIKYDSIMSTTLQGKATFTLKLNENVVEQFILNSQEINGAEEALQYSMQLSKLKFPEMAGTNLKFQIYISEYLPKGGTKDDFEMPFSLDIELNAQNPVQDPNIQIKFGIELENPQPLKQNDIAKYSIYVKNDKEENIGMVVAIIRVPAAFEISYESLEKLKSSKIFSQLEVNSGNEIY